MKTAYKIFSKVNSSLYKEATPIIAIIGKSQIRDVIYAKVYNQTINQFRIKHENY